MEVSERRENKETELHWTRGQTRKSLSIDREESWRLASTSYIFPDAKFLRRKETIYAEKSWTTEIDKKINKNENIKDIPTKDSKSMKIKEKLNFLQ
jgi:hypothetical protein